MSRKYQGLIILNTKSHTGSIDELIGTVTKELEAEGAKVAKISQLGRRNFAYPARHIDAGHYVNIDFEGSPEAITKIQGRLRLNGHVHLQHFSRVA